MDVFRLAEPRFIPPRPATAAYSTQEGGSAALFRFGRELALRGIRKSLFVHGLCGLFAEGLAAYRARDWDQSERCFALCLAVMPTEGPATVFHRRIKLLRGETLPTDWDGVWQLTDK